MMYVSCPRPPKSMCLSPLPVLEAKTICTLPPPRSMIPTGGTGAALG